MTNDESRVVVITGNQSGPVQWRNVTDEDPGIQVLQKHTHLVAEEGKAQAAEEQAEDDACIGRLVSANSPSSFKSATGILPQQYAI